MEVCTHRIEPFRLWSRGAQYDHLEKENWWAGPPWIQDSEKWSKIEVNLEASIESIQGELKRGDQLLYCVEDNANLKENG